MGQEIVRSILVAISAEVGAKLEKYVTKLVAQGRYNSKSEVVREGLRLVQERETRFATLDAAIKRGLADVEAGRLIPAEEVFTRLKAKYRAMR